MKNTPKPGSFVEVTQTVAGKEIVQKGTVLPRGELYAPGILVLKLENGYNVGISDEKIQNLVVVREPESPAVVKRKITTNPDLPNVAFVSFGGTISSRLDYKTGGVVADYDATDFYEMMPELADIANITASCGGSKMSEDLNFSDYELMAKTVRPLLADDSISGIVLTQGTDTLHYSTAALSFLLGDLNKPVIFTAAQRSIDRGSSDGFENIICAVRAAANWDGAAVVTCMHETTNDGACILIRGTKVRKMHTSRRDAFRPINEQALARITLAGEITPINEDYAKRGEKTLSGSVVKMESDVGLLFIHPGIKSEQVTFFADKKYKGLVIAATAFGHVPEQIMADVKKLAKSIPVIITSQTIYGRVNALVYSRLREMSIEGNMLFADDLMPEVAYVKLGWALGQATDIETVFTLMKQNVAGEYAGEIDEKSFLN